MMTYRKQFEIETKLIEDNCTGIGDDSGLEADYHIQSKYVLWLEKKLESCESGKPEKQTDRTGQPERYTTLDGRPIDKELKKRLDRTDSEDDGSCMKDCAYLNIPFNSVICRNCIRNPWHIDNYKSNTIPLTTTEAEDEF